MKLQEAHNKLNEILKQESFIKRELFVLGKKIGKNKSLQKQYLKLKEKQNKLIYKRIEAVKLKDDILDIDKFIND